MHFFVERWRRRECSFSTEFSSAVRLSVRRAIPLTGSFSCLQPNARGTGESGRRSLRHAKIWKVVHRRRTLHLFGGLANNRRHLGRLSNTICVNDDADATHCRTFGTLPLQYGDRGEKKGHGGRPEKMQQCSRTRCCYVIADK